MSGNNLNKVKAYKKVAKNYYESVDILNRKKLAFGEPAVVPFYYPDESDLDRVIKLTISDAFDYVIGKINEYDYDVIDDVIIDIINGSLEQNI